MKVIDNENIGRVSFHDDETNQLLGYFDYSKEKKQIYSINVLQHLIGSKIHEEIQQEQMKFIQVLRQKLGMTGEMSYRFDLEAYYTDKDGNKIPIRFKN